MNFIEHTNRWIAGNRSALERTGPTSISASGDGRAKQAIHIATERAGRFAEIIVWDTGEAEFGFGATGGVQSDEHHDLVDTVELDQLLGRFLARVQDLRS